MDPELFQSIVTEIAETATDPYRWPSALSLISTAAQAVGSVVLPIKGRMPDLAMSEPIAELANDYFAGAWHQRDLRDRGVPVLLRTGTVVERDTTTPAEMNSHR